MNQAFQTALAASLFLTLPLAPARGEIEQQVKPIANNGWLNVRSGPGANFADIGDIASGTVINVLGYDPSGGWAIILWQGQVAYVARSFLTDVAAPAVNSGLGMQVVSGIPANDPDGGLVVRTGPGRSFPRVFVLPQGTPVRIVEISPDRKWSRAEFAGGGSGWMRNSYLRPQAAPGTASGAGSGQDSPEPPGQPATATLVITTANTATPVYRAPDDTAPVLATLPPNTALAMLEIINRQDWVKVSTNGEVGFIHARGAATGGGSTSPEGMQLGLTCAGTEPFWTFNIGADLSTSYEDINIQGSPLTGSISSISQSGYPYQFQSGQVLGKLSNQVCSDGMSDITYPWKLLLRITSGGVQQDLQGCCLMQ